MFTFRCYITVMVIAYILNYRVGNGVCMFVAL